MNWILTGGGVIVVVENHKIMLWTCREEENFVFWFGAQIYFNT